MLDRPYRIEVGPYRLLLPHDARVAVTGPTPVACEATGTHWTVTVGRFQLMLHLDPLHDLGELKSFTDRTTKGDIALSTLEVNGVSGVTHGDYGPPRTWIDWWFKKGDTMLCACLQSVKFPHTEPSADERAEHAAIIGSLNYCRDFSSETPPLPE